MDIVIRVENLRKVYYVGNDKVVALDNINLQIPRGQICCIIGTSGSGKSTLLNMLAGLEKPTRGKVFLGKNDIARLDETRLARLRQKNIGFVFQSYNLLHSMTALENVALPMVFKGISKSERTKAAKKMLKAVGLLNRMHHRPSQMSGGQQQRVGIARAFVAKPKIIFADEPTGNLDTNTTKEILEIMAGFSRKNNQTLVIVTHDIEIAHHGDRMIRLSDGNIIEDRIKNENGEFVDNIGQSNVAAKTEAPEAAAPEESPPKGEGEISVQAEAPQEAASGPGDDTADAEAYVSNGFYSKEQHEQDSQEGEKFEFIVAPEQADNTDGDKKGRKAKKQKPKSKRVVNDEEK